MKENYLLIEFMEYLKDKNLKALVKAYLKNLKIEDVDRELQNLFSGD